jgi:RNA polymerase primary sigma factor
MRERVRELAAQQLSAVDVDDYLDRRELGRVLEETLRTLSPLDARVLRMRFGLGCRPQTLQAIGDMYGVGRERVRRIQDSALRKLRHPSRAARLRDWAGLQSWEKVK